MGTWWIILAVIVATCVNAVGAFFMRNAAIEKGYGDDIHAWAACFWLGIFGYLYVIACQTAHCGRGKPHFDFGNNISLIVRYRHLPQTLIGMTVDCCSLV